ncbi:transcriptional protein SWT1 isoform X1 [Pimephales promelas]|uniref:transcriptional protein SWT1 isoform X1 n=2 Tax=Pimephales promelas TaxID=90988 RepID=UPI0019557D72|nr:transcriptional protein SWT1 isoform X1 [Pimephales promelas]KAG1963714.1 transcriptional protein SWT1 [Pimephales promelas]
MGLRMSSKKSKKKKHKKDERMSSSSLREDEKKEKGTKRFSSPKSKHKHHHQYVSSDKDEAKWRRAVDSASARGVDTKLKKTDAGDNKRKKEKSRESKETENSRPVFKSPVTHDKEQVNPKGKHEIASAHVSGKSSSKHAGLNQPSSKDLEKKRKELVSRRRSATEDCRRTPAKDDCSTEKLQEKKRKPMKRTLSPELHAEPKRRDDKNMTKVAHADCSSEVQKVMLVSRSFKKFNQTVGAQSSCGKTVNDNSKEALPVVKHVNSGSKLKLLEEISPKKQDHVQLDNVPGENLKEKRPSFGGLTANVSFKIPMKATAVKVRTNTNVHSSDSSTQCSPQPNLPSSTPSKRKYFVTQQQVQKPKEVLPQTSHRPSSLWPSHPSYISHQVQQVHTDKTREVSIQSNTSCKAQNITPQEAEETFDCDHEMELVEELHLARSERRLEVNLVENCGELTCMDIDPPEECASTILNQHKQALLIVLDTNVLLSHLEFVKKIRSHGLSGLGFPTLLIPWVVLQELDYLKSGKLSSKVEDKARPAVHYIYSCLKNQEPRLMGQSMQQASQAACGPGVVNNDDRVLECCLQYQALYPEGALVLCTNDKNLCSKALLSGVKALSKADLVKEVEGTRSTILNCFHAHPAVPLSAGPVDKAPYVNEAEKEGPQKNRSRNAAEERQLSECVSLLESCLQEALSEVLQEEMKAAYGDLWTEIVYVKPPWSLDGLLKCFKKHWIAVFGSIIKRSLLSTVEMLSDCLCSDRSIEHRSVHSAVRLAAELLSALAGRSQYNGHVAHALSTLQMLQERLQSPKAPVEDEDSLMTEIEEDVAPPLTSHQEVWTLFESIWNNVCQISSALFSALHYTPGTTEPSPRSTSPLPQDALSCLQRLSTALKQLLEALQRLLSADSSVQDAQSLLSFIQSSKIAAMEPRFTARDLFDCVSQQEYREKLCVGGAQLSELYANLDHCAGALRP